MKQVKIGDSQASCLGIGAMSFSDFYGKTTDENSWAILDAARAAGVTHVDTSNVYGMGRSEKAIGAYLAQNSGARADFHIATKAGITRNAEGVRYYNNTLDHLESELDKSLEKMGVDYVDLFYVHRRDADTPIEQVSEALGVLKQKGKTRAIGFSEIAPSSLRRADAAHKVDAVQSEYSLSTRAPELGLVQTCAELGTALVAFSPVGRGLLTDNPIERERLPDLEFLKANPRFMEPNLTANLAITDTFRAFAVEKGEPAAAIAIAWLLSRGDHVLPIPGTRSASHFRELVRGAQISLSAGDLARIDALLPVGWCHGDRYNFGQWNGPERYC